MVETWMEGAIDQASYDDLVRLVEQLQEDLAELREENRRLCSENEMLRNRLAELEVKIAPNDLTNPARSEKKKNGRLHTNPIK
jgi:regulator of replication initiation timing